MPPSATPHARRCRLQPHTPSRCTVNGLEEGSTRLEVSGEDLVSTSEALRCSLQNSQRGLRWSLSSELALAGVGHSVASAPYASKRVERRWGCIGQSRFRKMYNVAFRNFKCDSRLGLGGWRSPPMAHNHPLVDAWCMCTIDKQRMVIGLQVTTAKFQHPIAGEAVAKKHFNAIHDAFATHGVSVDKAAWVVFVLPLANIFSKFPYQHAKVGPGEPRRKAGCTWSHTQAKLGMPLGEQGQPPAIVAAMRGMLSQSSTVQLSADVTTGDLCTLYHVGPRCAEQLSPCCLTTRETIQRLWRTSWIPSNTITRPWRGF